MAISIENLDALIAGRLENPEEYPESRTLLLAGAGLDGMAEKVGEETGELIQAVVEEEDNDVLNEAQQLLFMTAVSLSLSQTPGGLRASLELAKRELWLPSDSQNEVVKNLGRGALAFGFALGKRSRILESGARLISGVDAGVRFRKLTLSDVLERI